MIPWHVYSNPLETLTFPNLSLSRYLLTLKYSFKKIIHCCIKSHYERYSNMFLNLVGGNAHELKLLGNKNGICVFNPVEKEWQLWCLLGVLSRHQCFQLLLDLGG